MLNRHETHDHILFRQDVRKYVTQQVENPHPGRLLEADPHASRLFWLAVTQIIYNYFFERSAELSEDELGRKALIDAGNFYLRANLLLSTESDKDLASGNRWWLTPRHKVIDHSLAQLYLLERIVKEEKEIWLPLTDSQHHHRAEILKQPPILSNHDWTKAPLAAKFQNIGKSRKDIVQPD